MNFVIPDNYNFWNIGFGLYVANTLRYLIIAGGAFVIFYVVLKHKFSSKRIQKKFPSNKDFVREIIYSLLTFVIFSFIGIFISLCKRNGFTLMYNDINDYGIVWYVISIILMLLLHDTYFYWTHRLMHHKKIFPVFHKVHHLSNNPSPWAAFAFHPLEAVIEGGILILIVFIIPSHLSAILIFLVIMTVMNVIGHLGYELYPKNFLKNSFSRLNNTSTHHNMHHRLVNCNYGLYFNWWDKWMGTNHKDYNSEFLSITSKNEC
ncbi:MAG: sterol desaturase family protein [Bacteroidetes bacterium]|nr:sterol desaturase family protein [Bacteroidota bacterium]HNR20848.1 sterol desaturase family protein [Bacteroidia bacterium]HNU33907.1 sterol desaturase family protein [Bacteroidia bacterium]